MEYLLAEALKYPVAASFKKHCAIVVHLGIRRGRCPIKKSKRRQPLQARFKKQKRKERR
jgi:hypothetical protein